MDSPNHLEISLDGRATIVGLERVPLDQLVLDEFNPRISFFKDNQAVADLSEQQVEFALSQGNPEAWRKLKDSIHNNRGVVNPIWVEPVDLAGGRRFRVIEGNSRVLACRRLAGEEPGEALWHTILAYVLPDAVSAEQKNFIRLLSHLRGATDWDAYDKAKYLYRLWDEDGWPIDRLEKQTKMTRRQIEQNIEAYRLMTDQYLPKHGADPAAVSKFSYFVEYVRDKKLQQLLAKYAGGIDGYCDWVADRNKLPRGLDVRKLRPMLENDDARRALLRSGFDAAMDVLALRAPQVVTPFYRDIESVIQGLKDFTMADAEDIASDRLGGRLRSLGELADWSRRALDMVGRAK